MFAFLDLLPPSRKNTSKAFGLIVKLDGMLCFVLTWGFPAVNEWPRRWINPALYVFISDVTSSQSRTGVNKQPSYIRRWMCSQEPHTHTHTQSYSFLSANLGCVFFSLCPSVATWKVLFWPVLPAHTLCKSQIINVWSAASGFCWGAGKDEESTNGKNMTLSVVCPHANQKQ